MLISNDVTYDWLGLLITFKYILVVIDYINIGTKAPHSATIVSSRTFNYAPAGVQFRAVLARSITRSRTFNYAPAGVQFSQFSHVQLRSSRCLVCYAN